MDKYTLNELFEELVKRVLKDPRYIKDRKAADLDPTNICLFINPLYDDSFTLDSFSVSLHTSTSRIAEFSMGR